jgi:hypothetical protein
MTTFDHTTIHVHKNYLVLIISSLLNYVKLKFWCKSNKKFNACVRFLESLLTSLIFYFLFTIGNSLCCLCVKIVFFVCKYVMWFANATDWHLHPVSTHTCHRPDQLLCLLFIRTTWKVVCDYFLALWRLQDVFVQQSQISLDVLFGLWCVVYLSDVVVI